MASSRSPVVIFRGFTGPPYSLLPTLMPSRVLLTLTDALAGQYSLGRKCSFLSSTQCQEPSAAGLERTLRPRSTTALAALSLTGALSSAVMGWPTPYLPALGPKVTERLRFTGDVSKSSVRLPGAPSSSSVATLTV